MSVDDSPFSDLSGEVFPEGSDNSARSSLFAVFAYVPFLCLVPILRMHENENLRFHARQGLVLFLIELVAGVFLIPALSSLIWKAVLIACIASSVVGVLFALQGRRIRLPIIGDLASKIKI